MSNPLYNQFGGNNNFIQQVLSQFQSFKNSFNGNPQEEVQKLLNSGQMSQQQFNQLSQMANQIMPFVKR